MEVQNLEVEGDDIGDSKMDIEEEKENPDKIIEEQKDVGLKQLAKMATQD